MDILIVDDHMLIRRGLARILAEDARVGRVDEAGDGPSALRALRAHAYQAMLLDIALGERDGLDLLKTVRGEFPALGVVMLSVYPETHFAVRALKSGAHAYLNKGCQPEEVLEALARAAAGQLYITRGVAELLAQNVRRDETRAPHELLSNREFQVMQLLAGGKTVSEIGEQLALSANTISTYRGRIFDKLGVRTLVELVDYTRRHQLGALQAPAAPDA